jgi:hypothetical protein
MLIVREFNLKPEGGNKQLNKNVEGLEAVIGEF